MQFSIDQYKSVPDDDKNVAVVAIEVDHLEGADPVVIHIDRT
jgi:hypothetical protein